MDIASLIERLGGRAFLASRFGTTVKAIEQWEQRSRIPWHRHDALVTLAMEKGFALSHAELAALNRTAADEAGRSAA